MRIDVADILVEGDDGLAGAAELVIPFPELAELGGDAGGIAKAIAAKGALTLWQYGQKHAANGERQMAPVSKIGVLANNSLRVEPYSQPFKVLPHE